MMMLIELFAALLFPMEISFFRRGFKINYICKLVIYFFFILDMLMKFNTVHIDKGIWIRERKIILKHYFNNSFASDFIAFLSLSYWLKLSSSDTFGWTSVFCFLVILKISHSFKLMREK